MTGRELIMYILENHLEDEPVFQNGTFVGYMSDKKFAEMLGVGLATVHTWILLGRIQNVVTIGNSVLIPINCSICTEAKHKTKGSDDKCITK